MEALFDLIGVINKMSADALEQSEKNLQQSIEILKSVGGEG